MYGNKVVDVVTSVRTKELDDVWMTQSTQKIQYLALVGNALAALELFASKCHDLFTC